MSLKEKLDKLIPYHDDELIRSNTEYDFSYSIHIWQLSETDIKDEIDAIINTYEGFDLYVDGRPVYKTVFKKVLENAKVAGREGNILEDMGFDIMDSQNIYEPKEIDRWHYDICLSVGEHEIEDCLDILIDLVTRIKSLKSSSNLNPN